MSNDMADYYKRKAAESEGNGDSEAVAAAFRSMMLRELASQSDELADWVRDALATRRSLRGSHVNGAIVDCVKCGCLVDPGWNFCPNCGACFINDYLVVMNADDDGKGIG